MKNKNMSTFDKFIQNKKWKSSFEKGYKKFLMTEFEIDKKNKNKLIITFNKILKYINYKITK